jgi:adenylate kinase
MRISLLGPPGSGKGTQGEVLRERLRVAHVSSGDLLRDAVARGTELGRAAKGYMDRGELVPDALVLGMIRERLAATDCDGGWLLDGFPRTLAQAEALDGLLAEERKGGLDHVVALNVPTEDVVVRLGGRRTCAGCGRLFHVKFQPSKDGAKCEGCGAELVTRRDDEEATIRARLDVYDRQTAPLLDYYRKRGLLREIDGVAAPAQVSGRILAALNGRGGGR